jgi:ABC-type glutathione transport system ATPase component
VDQEGGRLMQREPILTARGLVKRYGRVTALDSADFDLYPGEILAVIGDNGAGKSSLIKALSGAMTPDEGEIRLEGKPVSFRSPMEAREAGIETVYQNLVTGAVDRRQHVPWPRDQATGVAWPLAAHAGPACHGKARPRHAFRTRADDNPEYRAGG